MNIISARPSLRRPVLLGLTALATATLCLAGVGGTAAAAGSPLQVGVSHRPPPSHPPATTGPKAPAYGLLDRHHAPPAPYTSVIHTYVVDTTWASLQPLSGAAIAHPNDIDRAVTYARANGMTLTLRVRAGIDAPAWAKTLDGPPIPMYYTKATPALAGRAAGTIGRYWSPGFTAAYARLQVQLAALYDGVPEIRETDVTQCASIFAETYLRDAEDPRNEAGLRAAGFTRTVDDACHAAQIKAHLAWRNTLSAVSFNPYQWIHDDGKVGPDLAYTLAQMSYCRSVLGRRCVLANHSLSQSRISTPSSYATMYATMRSLGAPFAFQTATADKVGNLAWVLNWAAADGAASVELPTGYQTFPLSTFSQPATVMAASGTNLPPATRVRAQFQMRKPHAGNLASNRPIRYIRSRSLR